MSHWSSECPTLRRLSTSNFIPQKVRPPSVVSGPVVVPTKEDPDTLRQRWARKGNRKETRTDTGFKGKTTPVGRITYSRVGLPE